MKDKIIPIFQLTIRGLRLFEMLHDKITGIVE